MYENPIDVCLDPNCLQPSRLLIGIEDYTKAHWNHRPYARVNDLKDQIKEGSNSAIKLTKKFQKDKMIAYVQREVKNLRSTFDSILNDIQSVFIGDIEIMHKKIEEIRRTSQLIRQVDIEGLKTCTPQQIMDLVNPNEDSLLKIRFLNEELQVRIESEIGKLHYALAPFIGNINHVLAESMCQVIASQLPLSKQNSEIKPIERKEQQQKDG